MHTDEAVRKSQDIIAYLLRRRSLDKSGGEVYEAFFSESVSRLVRMQAEALGAQIAYLGEVVYLIPDDGNTFLGFTRAELRNRLTRGGQRSNEERGAAYAVAMFAIIVLIQEFYGGSGEADKLRDFLPFGEWQNAIADALQAGVAACGDGGGDAGLMSYPEMLGAWNALISSGENNARRNTKEGFLGGILSFLKAQKLALLDDMDAVRVLPKMDHQVPALFLDRSSAGVLARLDRLLRPRTEGPEGAPAGVDATGQAGGTGEETRAESEREEA
ncbi:MAG: hypothetical protein J5600_00285, partial [Desulfovibrio sp.]|nr:hypothetical protein [Desulfovibrio sp.]